MNRFSTTILLAALGSLPALAQRLDGCPDDQTARMIFSLPSSEAIDHGLQVSGIGSTREALAVALIGPKPDVRSLAALKIGGRGERADLFDLLMQASLAEKDACTKLALASALGSMASALVHDPAQHPGVKPWIAPDKPCTPAEPPVVQVMLAQGRPTTSGAPTVEISIRNLTGRLLPFVVAVPEELFSVSVFDVAGTPVKTKGKDYMFDQTPKPFSLAFNSTASLLFVPPGGDAHFWTWNIADDFDLSEPGIYHVSLGGRIAYLDTTACSNTTEIKVGN